jgi:hypothetical protein
LIGEERLSGLHKLLDLTGDLMNDPLSQASWRQVATAPFDCGQQLQWVAGEAKPQQPIPDAPAIQARQVDGDLLIRRFIGSGHP